MSILTALLRTYGFAIDETVIRALLRQIEAGADRCVASIHLRGSN